MPRRRVVSRPPLPRRALLWFPPRAMLEDVERFRALHDPLAHSIAAHLTLVFPFATSLTRLQVETHVKRVASRWPPIPVTFRAVRMHANEFVFLTASRGAESIVTLHDRLYSRSFLPYLRRELPYEPHITLARNAHFEALQAAYEEARETFGAELGDVLRAVTLLSVERDGRIERLGEIALHSA
jgi:2'-5' RNA ligase